MLAESELQDTNLYRIATQANENKQRGKAATCVYRCCKRTMLIRCLLFSLFFSILILYGFSVQAKRQIDATVGGQPMRYQQRSLQAYFVVVSAIVTSWAVSFCDSLAFSVVYISSLCCNACVAFIWVTRFTAEARLLDPKE